MFSLFTCKQLTWEPQAIFVIERERREAWRRLVINSYAWGILHNLSLLQLYGIICLTLFSLLLAVGVF